MTLDLVVVTGLSGAGRSTAAKSLEDLGWFVVDNLPPGLLPTMVDLGLRSNGAVERIAVVADVRSRAFTSDLQTALDEVRSRGVTPRLLFLESTDEVLLRRFDSVRRPHPMQGEGRITQGISDERLLLQDLRGAADLVLDTSRLNVHHLRGKIAEAFGGLAPLKVQLTVLSFGYKYGLPVDADVVLDCRFLPNPHWIDELRPQTGLDAPVRDFVMAQAGAAEFLDSGARLLALLLEGYLREDKPFGLFAIGCTGGKHRSVAMATALAARLGSSADVTLTHRDLGRE